MSDAAETTTSGDVAAAPRPLWQVATGWYLVNRLVTTIALYLSVWLAGSRFGWRYVLLTGDGRFYVDISRFGYFDLPTRVDGHRIFSSIGFFPLLPMLIRAADAVLPGDALVAGMVVATLAGWAACVAVTALAGDLYGAEAARRAAALIACFPGAYIFAFVYTEGLLVAAAAASLLLLRRERWVWAGLAGAVATAARPSGVAVVAAAAVVAAMALVRRRQWSALAAPALASVGMGSYLAYLWWRTGDAFAWFANQRDFWDQRNDAGGYLVDWVRLIGRHGFLPTDHRIYGFIVLALIPLVIFFYRHRPDVATTAYVTASLIITLSSSLGPRPRFLLAAFPLLLPVAQRWTGLRHQALVATGFGLLGLSLVYYAAGGPLAIEHFNFNGPVP